MHSHIELDLALRITLTYSPTSMCLEALVQLARVRHHRALVVRVRLHKNGRSQPEKQRAYDRTRLLACDISAASKSGLNPSWLSAVPIHEDSASDVGQKKTRSEWRAVGPKASSRFCWRHRWLLAGTRAAAQSNSWWLSRIAHYTQQAVSSLFFASQIASERLRMRGRR